MFNWFKEKEQKKQDTPVGVSEPVISFVETFKANPKRFKLRKVQNVIYSTAMCALHDWHLNLQYNYFYDYYGSGDCNVVIPFQFDWLSDEEKDYIISIFRPYYEERIERIRTYKTNKLNNKERQKYMKIYCKSN